MTVSQISWTTYREEIYKLCPCDSLQTQLLGLCAEAGEAANPYKKFCFGGTLDEEALKNELGDVLWHLSQITRILNVSMEELLIVSLNKTKKRNLK